MNTLNYTSGWEYFGLSMLLLAIIILIIVIMVYAKWLMWGPKFKLKWSQFKTWIISPFVKKNVSIKKGELIVDEEVQREINVLKSNASSPQDILEAQEKQIELDSQIKIAKEKLEAKANEATGYKKWTDKLFKKSDDVPPVETSEAELKNNEMNTIDSLLSNTTSKIEEDTAEIEFEKTAEIKLDTITSEVEIEDTVETETGDKKE